MSTSTGNDANASQLTRTRVLMVCMGNICRSPTAEAVLRHRVARAGLAAQVEIDSAGTHAWHTRNPPDERSIAHAARRGYDLTGLRARRIESADFERFDLLLAMDADNLAHLRETAPAEAHHRLRLLMTFAPQLSLREVPDPYYGGSAGFERVLDLIESACDGLVEHLRSVNGTPGNSR
ncbi:low molecular weight protein-tyrosine-phosphatase [Sphaerotilus microaerophilus]|uniref:protein-tyrosine-phosphatase n=1 Tax=Sphaerotilus microaerophilus TaxID=2914710 RepID=A0ABM7YJA3_9BURK|nr:low molecular weight protein-tyrosine-phosphatase [Sphaerotilus sp. FB-5]BDI04495.1 phosphotyrosine protein phosphatase [Sphaerotilus sp. FB-5]